MGNPESKPKINEQTIDKPVYLNTTTNTTPHTNRKVTYNNSINLSSNLGITSTPKNNIRNILM